MTTAIEPIDDWSAEIADHRASSDPTLVVDVDGFEGPLDLLLTLARTQKVDLTRISILALAEQYLDFIENLRRLRLEIAADYLVMAAWLAYLKSRLLLPEPGGDEEPTGEELAALLAFRLQRLEAMRHAATELMARNRLGRDLFGRGAPEPTIVTDTGAYTETLYDLLKAYAIQRQRTAITHYSVQARQVLQLADARNVLVRLVGEIAEWTPIDRFLNQYLADRPEERQSVLASSFSASLELVREGIVELRQTAAFSTLFMRRRGAAESTDDDDKGRTADE